MTLKGRVALVTEVSRRIGIGFAVADRLAAQGADIFIQSFAPYDAHQPYGADPAGVPALVDALRGHGGRVEHLEADFLDPTAPQRVVAAATESLGHLDIVVANHAHSTMGTLEEVTAEDIDLHYQVNVRGSLLLVKAFAAQHDGRLGGRVVLLTSGQHCIPMPGELAYIASKGALHQLTLSLSAHLVPRGITVNTVNPGATDTGYATAELYRCSGGSRRVGGDNRRMRHDSLPGFVPMRRNGLLGKSSIRQEEVRELSDGPCPTTRSTTSPPARGSD